MTQLRELSDFFSGIKKCAVAFSGGADSSLVLKIASDILGKKNVIAITGISETYPQSELKEATRIAREIGVKHLLISTRELKNKNFSCNTHRRCYYCKTELFSKIKQIALDNGFDTIVDGSNLDDLSDYRPGREAALRFGVRSPLVEKRVAKRYVRKILRRLGLSVWNKPQSPCLASRVPYGTQITLPLLKMIEKAEKIIKISGLRNIRVRHYGDIARIEVDKKDIPGLLKTLNPAVIKKIKSLGYKYITVDVEGFRSGSLNDGARP